MAKLKILRKLTGIVKGSKNLEASDSLDQLKTQPKALNKNLPNGDRVSKKRNWISAKYKK